MEKNLIPLRRESEGDVEFEFSDGSTLRVTDKIEIIVKDKTVFCGSLMELVEQFVDLDDLE